MKTVTMYGVLLFCAAAAELPLLPAELEIGEGTYAMGTPATAVPGARRYQLRKAERFSQDQASEQLDESLQHWFLGNEFLRTRDGEFALPFAGSAKSLGYFDLASGSFVSFDAFPPIAKTGKTAALFYHWSGAYEPEANALHLFVRRFTGKGEPLETYRAKIPLDNPSGIAVAPWPLLVATVLAQAKGELLCELIDGRSRPWARISTETWELIAKQTPVQKHGHLGPVAYSPNGAEIYAVYSHGGLVIYDAKTGAQKAHHPKIGGYFNAHTFGATFDPSGTVAVIATPYQQKIALVGTRTHAILAEYQTEKPLAGIAFDAEKQVAYPQETWLPYE